MEAEVALEAEWRQFGADVTAGLIGSEEHRHLIFVGKSRVNWLDDREQVEGRS
jgi:hypothetical protein